MSFRHRFAGHLGVRAPDRPLFRHIAGTADPVAQVALLADLSFAGVADNFLALRSIETQAAIGAAVARHGLEMGSFVHDPAHWDRPTWSATTVPERLALFAAFDASLSVAARSCSRTITCVTGSDPSVPRAVQIGAMIDNLDRAADLAANRGITWCIEATHPQFAPGLLIERVAEACDVIDRVDHPNVRLDLDLGHVALHGVDPVAAIRAAGDRIGMVQIADVPDRVEPGAGMLDWVAILDALDAAAFPGLIELECEPIGTGIDGEHALLARLAAIDAIDASEPV